MAKKPKIAAATGASSSTFSGDKSLSARIEAAMAAAAMEHVGDVEAQRKAMREARERVKAEA